MSGELRWAALVLLAVYVFLRPHNTAPVTIEQNNGNGQPILMSMLTAPRPSGARYLTEALHSVLSEIRDAPGLDLSVIVCNMRPGLHAEVTDLRRDPEILPFVEFVDLHGRKADLTADPWPGVYADVTPGMYQLNLDFIEYLSHTERTCRRRGIPLVLLVEDDFIWCPLGLAFLRRATSLAFHPSRAPHTGLRVSYGNNGLVLPCSSLPALLDYSETHKRLGPLDSLLGALLTGASDIPSDGRTLLVYRHNLMRHIGHLSVRGNGVYGQPTKAEEGDRGRRCYPACGAPIQYVGLMTGENFADECLEEEFSPCEANEKGGVPFPTVLAKVALRKQLNEC